jgi:hypothetical protein
MHQFHPSYMFNTSEVSNEYNLLNDFLNNSLMDDGAFYGGNDFHALFSDASLMNPIGSLATNSAFQQNTSRQHQLLPPPARTATGNETQKTSSVIPIDKARERYLITAADPAGSDSPEERMNKLLKAVQLRQRLCTVKPIHGTEFAADVTRPSAASTGSLPTQVPGADDETDRRGSCAHRDVVRQESDGV